MIVQVIDLHGTLIRSFNLAPEIPCRDHITYRPCAYCGHELVRVPRKFCCASHKVTYYRKQIQTVEIIPSR